MRILVTRPLPDAETTAGDLRRLGHDAVLAPMLETQFIDWSATGPLPLSEEPDALVATSLNGLRGLVGHPEIDRFRKLPLFVTGDASARLAGTLGFLDVHSAHGDVSDVVDCLRADIPPDKHLLYVAGHDRIGDLAGRLKSWGYGIDVVEVYRAVAVTSLPTAIAVDLRAGQIDRVLVFSARTAESFVSVLTTTDLLAGCRPIQIHAISEQAADPLRAAGFMSIVVALRPDAAELLASLEASR